MSEAYFTDKTQPPTQDAILAAVGTAAPAWRGLFDRIRMGHPDVTEAWNYYADGKSWLLKATRKSKTVFWTSVQRGSFCVVFYFAERLRTSLLEGALPERLKERIRATKPQGKLFGVRVEFGPLDGIDDVMALLALKKSLK